MAFGVCMNCFSNFPPSTGQKWKFLQNIFFDVVTIYNDEICYVKHVLTPLYVFFTQFSCGGGGGGWVGLGWRPHAGAGPRVWASFPAPPRG